MNYVFFIFLIVLLLFFRKTKVNLSNPLVLFWGTWIITILICSLNIFSMYNKISIKTYFYVMMFLIAPTIGFFLGRRLLFTNKNTEYSMFKLIISFNVLFCLICCAYILTIIKLGLPPAISGGDRSSYYLSGGGELVYLLVYPCFFLGLFLLKKVNIIKIVPQLIILCGMILTRGNKMAVFSIVLMLFYLYGKRIKLYNIIFSLLFVLIIFYLSTFIYTKNISDKYLLQSTRIFLTGFTLPNNLYFLFDPMIYFGSNLYNLNNLINMNMGNLGYGLISFQSIAQIFGIFIPSINIQTQNLQNVLNSSLMLPLFNTYSGFGLLYFDFGFIFTIIIMFIIGLLAGELYMSRSTYQLSLEKNFFGFILYQTLALSFFTFYLGNSEVVTNLIVMLIVSLFARKHIK